MSGEGGAVGGHFAGEGGAARENFAGAGGAAGGPFAGEGSEKEGFSGELGHFAGEAGALSLSHPSSSVKILIISLP